MGYILPRMNPNEHYGLRGDSDMTCSFIDFTKRITMVLDVDTGVAVCMWEQRGI